MSADEIPQFPEMRRRGFFDEEPVARIEHATEARKILAEIAAGEGNLPMDWSGATDDEQWLVMGGFAEAQVHATLALVEQQRAANLIAYLSADVIGGGPGSNGALDDIEKALGLS